MGGIRDIEFHIQALQLLYGGQDPWLRERNSLRALHRLAERGYLSWEESGRLAHGYVFLRTVEHRLQLLHALQTHTLPADPSELAKLARRLGYTGDREAVAQAFLLDYDRTRRTVRTAFEGFFDASGRAVPEAPPWDAAAVAAVGFADPERAHQNLRLLWEGPALVAVPAAVRTALRTLLPATLAALGSVPDPDAALDALERFVATAGPRTAYLARLAATPALLGGMLTFFTRSERLAQTLIARPELLDALGPAAGTRPRSARRLRAAFGEFAAPGAEDADRLRLFKQREELEIAWRDLVLGERPIRVAWALGELAEASVGIAWELAVAEARAALGEPLVDGRSVPALVVGMGKLGGRELDYGSDLDLVVLHDGPREVSPAAHVYFDRVVDRLYTILTAITRTGQVFRVDLRLRQGGKATALAHSLETARPLPPGGGGALGAPGARARAPDPRRPGARAGGSWRSAARGCSAPGSRRKSARRSTTSGRGWSGSSGGRGRGASTSSSAPAGSWTSSSWSRSSSCATARATGRSGRRRRASPSRVSARSDSCRMPRRARSWRPTSSFAGSSGRCASARCGRPTVSRRRATCSRGSRGKLARTSGRALLARHREVAEFVRAEYFRVVGGDA